MNNGRLLFIIGILVTYLAPQCLGQKKGAPLNGRETIRIDGAWRMKVDPADAGVKGEWFARVPTDVREVNVPGGWPKTDEESNRTVWYWKQIESPKSRPGWNVRLR